MATAKLTGSYSVFSVDSYAESVAHYVDWLGFNLGWEWRAAPEAPAIVSLSRDSVSLMLNEADAVATGSQLTVFVDDLQAGGRVERSRLRHRRCVGAAPV